MPECVRFDQAAMEPIHAFSSRLASSVRLGSGSGESHTYVVRFEAGGEIGEHETGFGQLFIVIDGSGWVESEGDRRQVEVGDAVFLPRGVLHAKGSDAGMTAVMVQAFDLVPAQRS